MWSVILLTKRLTLLFWSVSKGRNEPADLPWVERRCKVSQEVGIISSASYLSFIHQLYQPIIFLGLQKGRSPLRVLVWRSCSSPARWSLSSPDPSWPRSCFGSSSVLCDLVPFVIRQWCRSCSSGASQRLVPRGLGRLSVPVWSSATSFRV